MQVLEDHDGEDVVIVEYDIETEDEESELDHERTQTTDYPSQNLVTRSELPGRIADEMIIAANF